MQKEIADSQKFGTLGPMSMSACYMHHPILQQGLAHGELEEKETRLLILFMGTEDRGVRELLVYTGTRGQLI